MPITTKPKQAPHFINGATAASMKTAIKSVNQLYSDGYIDWPMACSLKKRCLEFVAVSHQDVIANLFIV